VSLGPDLQNRARHGEHYYGSKIILFRHLGGFAEKWHAGSVGGRQTGLITSSPHY
jgi:hypothetical protein